ncbi:MAG: ATP-binding protein, partial [Myxococcales bacterium]
DRERIFAPFFRRAVPAAALRPTGDPAGVAPTGPREATALPAPRAVSGHGLGLALVRQVARYHGGEVVHQTPLAGGSRFEVRLPLTHPTAPAAA